MHRLAHTVSGGMIATLPGPDEDHNPETAASLAAVLGAREDIPYAERMQVARLVEDLTVSDQAGWYSVISLHGGGSPEAMKREIWRNYPVMEKGGSRRVPARARRRRRRADACPSSGPCCTTAAASRSFRGSRPGRTLRIAAD